MKNAIAASLFLVVATLTGCVMDDLHPDAFTVAVRGEKPACAIVLPKDASPSQQYAAEELCDYIKRQTGVELPICGDAARKIVFETVNSPQLGEDGFEIKCEGRTLRLRGSNVRGCLYAVYELLERFGGCEWYASWYEEVPKLKAFTVPQGFTYSSVPAFLMRQSFWYDFSIHPRFAARLRCNGYEHTGKNVDTKMLKRLGGNSFRFGGGLSSCHTFNTLCDPKIYFKDHPEYFSLVNGKRIDGRTQLCLTNPDVLAIVTSNVLERIRKDPGARFYGVSQNDWYNFCECEKCKAIDEEEESHAGTMIRFVNAVAERVEKEFPDVFIETLAYQYTRKPPKKTRIRKNVVICLCTIELDFARSIPESPYEENKKFMNDIKGWAQQTDKLYVWDYVTQFSHYVQPFANLRALQGNIKFFRDNSVKMLFEQGAYQGYHAGFAELKGWLLAKLMWNAQADVDELTREFCTGYYGAAAPYVLEYLDMLHDRQLEISSNPKNPLKIFDSPDKPPYNEPEFIKKGDELWAKALAAVKCDRVRTDHVKAGVFSHNYARFESVRLKNLGKDLKDKPESLAQLRKLLKIWDELPRRTVLNEWYHNQLLDEWRRIDEGRPLPPQKKNK